MDTKLLKQITSLAKNDPEFFHALIFNPEKAIHNLALTDEITRTGLLQMDPVQLMNLVLQPEKTCNPTCEGSCSVTCSGGGSCNVTCKGISCSKTCVTVSCGVTHAIAPDEGGAF